MLTCLISQSVLCEWRDMLPEMPDFGIVRFFHSMIQYRPIETAAVVGGAGVIFFGGCTLYGRYQQDSQQNKQNKKFDEEKKNKLDYIKKEQEVFSVNYKRLKNNCDNTHKNSEDGRTDLERLQNEFLIRARYESGKRRMTLKEAEEEYCYKKNENGEELYNPTTSFDPLIAVARDKELMSYLLEKPYPMIREYLRAYDILKMKSKEKREGIVTIVAESLFPEINPGLPFVLANEQLKIENDISYKVNERYQKYFDKISHVDRLFEAKGMSFKGIISSNE
jgi:hypothetical protein